MIAAIAGAFFAIGLLVLAQGLFPAKPGLSARLSQFSDQDLGASATDHSLVQSLAVMLLETVKGEKLQDLQADLDVTDITFEHMAMEKVKAAGGAGFLAAAVAYYFDAITGPVGLLMTLVIGAVVGYVIPDFDLRKKAAERRTEFSRALTAFITLLGSSIAGGGGVSTAMNDAAAMGNGWVFVKLRDALDTAYLEGTSSWIALDKLGRKLQVGPLIELAGSLTLAGTSGARVTETLTARAESSRTKELTDARAQAEAQSSKLGMPIGLMLLAWAVFMGYPAIQNLVGGQ